MEKYFTSQRLLRTYIYVIAFILGCLSTNQGFGTRKILKNSFSNIFTSVLNNDLGTDIVYAEYFIDDDPGFGKGISIPITASSAIEHTFSVIMPSTLGNGLHTITIRYKDSSGNWSISSPRSFLKESLITNSAFPDIILGEYFIDNDPGFGKGVSITIADSSVLGQSIAIPLASTLNDGLHTLTVRYKDALGNWSISSPRAFLKESLLSSSAVPKIVYCEYFIDNDPGFGKGTVVETMVNNTFDQSLTISIPTALSEGLHLITVRYQDELGNWSISSARAFIKESSNLGMPLPELVYAEYFIDDDPGISKGKAISFKAGQTIQNLLFDINLNNLGLTNGQHFLQLRVKDVNNVWSVVGTKTFVLSNELVRISLANIIICSTGTVQIPYTTEGVFNSNNQFKIELSDERGEFPTNPKVLGFITSKGSGQIPINISDKSWLDKYKIRIVSTSPLHQGEPINIISKSLTPTISVTNSTICQGASTLLSATGCEGTIKWTGGLTGNLLTVTPAKTISYKAECSENTCKSDSSIAVTITVIPKPQMPVVSSSNSAICLGESVVLTANGCNETSVWTNGLKGNQITVTPAKTSTYKVYCANIDGCQSDSSLAKIITVTPKPLAPDVQSNNTSIFLGANAQLIATGCNGIVSWSNGLTGSSVTVMPNNETSYKAVCTVNGCTGDSSAAITIKVIATPLSSIELVPLSEVEFKVFPNPTTNVIHVMTDLSGEVTFRLFSLLGQLLIEKSFKKKTKISLEGLNKGEYYYQIQYQEYRKKGKVLLE